MKKQIYMKKRNIFKLLSIITLAVFAGSCDKLLDVEPEQSIFSEDALTHEGMVNTLYGAYARLGGPELYAGTSIYHSDLLANDGDANWAGTFIGYRQMNWKELDPNDGTITAKWLASYRAINSVNTVLKNLNLVNEGDRGWVEGEAKFIRGILLFELVRFYGLPYEPGQTNSQPGVPLILEPFADLPSPSANVSRATVEAVYTQVVSDLVDARDMLSPAIAGGNQGRATSTVASAFLSRVYLAMGMNAEAANQATIVIDQFGGEDALNDTPRAAFNNDNYTSEDVFMIVQNATSNAGQANAGIGTFMASLPGYGRGDFRITDAHIARYEEGDLRARTQVGVPGTSITVVREMHYIGVGTRRGFRMTSKWGKYDANINVIRLAEMFLTRAEANFENGSDIGDEPLDDINVIRNRAGLDELEVLTREDIHRERRLELAWEGHRLHDAKRWKETIYDGDTPLEYDSPRLVLPIPQREIDVNDNLEQNPGY